MVSENEGDLALPYTIEKLIEILDKVYPEQSALLDWTEKEVWFKAGQRSVIKWLIELQMREQEQNED